MKNFMNKISLFFKAISSAADLIHLSKKQRQIVFYSEGRTYWPHLKSLLISTLKKTNNTVCYISSSLDDPGLSMKHKKLRAFYIGMGFVRDYVFRNIDTNIMIMTMPDLNSFQVKRSIHNVHYVYVQHSLCSLHMVYRHGAFDHYDTICAAGPHHVEEIRAIEAKYNRPRKNVVELGYSRLDSLIETSKKYQKSELIENKTHKKILVAPSWGSEGLIESGLGKTLVEQLLKVGHEVVLRPHPQTIKFARAKVDEIRKQHKDNLRFAFEGSVAGQESLHQSDIMVSDWSGAAIEYAFALNKPVIFCDVPRKVNNPNYKDIEIEPLEVSIREKIGIVWDGVAPVVELIEHCEQKSKHDLRTLTDQHVFNVGCSDKALIQIKGLFQ